MKFRNFLLSLILVVAIALTACGTPTPDAMINEPTDEAMMEKPATETVMENPTADAMMPHENSTPEAMMETPTEGAMMDSPAWFSAALTDVRTGQSFTINDFKNKVVLVETMAVWCSKCYQQQVQIQALHAALGERENLVSISLDIDPNEDTASVQSYLANTGFDWRYAVAPAEVSRELSALYGAQFLNPPSAPALVIDQHGVVIPLPFGVKSVDQLMQFIQPLLEAGM